MLGVDKYANDETIKRAFRKVREPDVLDNGFADLDISASTSSPRSQLGVDESR